MRLREPSILAVLAGGPAHGYSLVSSMEDLTDGCVSADTGGLYRCLRNLETAGLVTSTWAAGEHGPFKREYALTDTGRAALEEWVLHLRHQAHCLEAIAVAAESALARGSEVVDTVTSGEGTIVTRR